MTKGWFYVVLSFGIVPLLSAVLPSNGNSARGVPVPLDVAMTLKGGQSYYCSNYDVFYCHNAQARHNSDCSWTECPENMTMKNSGGSPITPQGFTYCGDPVWGCTRLPLMTLANCCDPI